MDEYLALVIDDNSGDRKLIRRLLARVGVSSAVLEADCVAAALAMAGPEPDVIFLDYLLPGRSGLSALPEVREKWPGAAIIMMTGQGDETVAKSAILNGAADYITKNVINQNALQRMVRNGVDAARMKWRLEQQRQDLATFSDVLVHDLKAPMRAVAYLADQIAEDFEAGELKEAGEGLALLKKSALRMQRMVTALHDHIHLDRQEKYENAAVRDLIAGALDALELDIVESGAEVSVEIDPQIDELYCDSPLVSQVLQNLIGNAIKYSGDKAPRVAVQVHLRGSEARFEVIDNGIGIAPEYSKTIFEPFKRAPGLGDVQGSGLGLATCRKLVLRQNGRIWCESVPGEGTTMIFCLPILAVPATATPLSA